MADKITREQRRLQRAADGVAPWIRYVLYGIAIVIPFGGVYWGSTRVSEATAATLTILGTLGPLVAVVYDRNTIPPRPSEIPDDVKTISYAENVENVEHADSIGHAENVNLEGEQDHD